MFSLSTWIANKRKKAFVKYGLNLLRNKSYSTLEEFQSIGRSERRPTNVKYTTIGEDSIYDLTPKNAGELVVLIGLSIILIVAVGCVLQGCLHCF